MNLIQKEAITYLSLWLLLVKLHVHIYTVKPLLESGQGGELKCILDHSLATHTSISVNLESQPTSQDCVHTHPMFSLVNVYRCSHNQHTTTH